MIPINKELVPKEHLLKRQIKKIEQREIKVDESCSFSILQWNTLARCYNFESHHPRCPKDKIQFEDRKHLIKQEIRSYDADFICLEEVDQRDLDFFISQCITEEYGFIFTKKNHSYDGCLFFYKKKFEILEEKICHHYKGSKNQKLDNQNSQINILRYTNKNQKLQEEEHIIIVGVSHFKAGPFHRSTRKIQVAQMIDNLEQTKKQYEEKYPKSTIHIVTCGDYNDNPDSSPVQAFVGENSKLKLKGETGFDTLTIDHAFPLFIFGLTISFQGVIDFILYSENLIPIETLESPTPENLGKNSIPHNHFPSDHLSLYRKFYMKKK